MQTRLTIQTPAGAPPGRGHLGVAPWVPLLGSLAIFVAGAVIGWRSLADTRLWDTGALIEPAQPSGGFLALTGEILMRNLPATLMLFAGVVTVGIATVLGLGFISTYVGATFGAAAGSVGAGDALGSILLYAPIEFAGLLFAAAAGLTPLASMVAGAFDEHRRRGLVGSYSDAVTPALRLLVVALALVVIGAVVEAAVISAR